MVNHGDYHAYKSTGGNSGGGSGGSLGCLPWAVLVIVFLLLMYFIINNANWDAIDSLLAFGAIAFLIARSIS